MNTRNACLRHVTGLVLLLVGCGERVVEEPKVDEDRARAACASRCALWDACGAGSSDCIDECAQQDTLQTPHCFDESIAWVSCQGEAGTCEWVERVESHGQVHSDASVCPDESLAYSTCVGQHRDEIDAAVSE